MNICVVHNSYRTFSGEEAVVNTLCATLEKHGHEVICFFRSSSEISKMTFGRFRAFCSGIYSLSAKQAFQDLLIRRKPHIVHIHNLFPLISTSILEVCKMAGVPVVMTVHNYRLICPIGLLAIHGQICEKCATGEHWCVLRNCTGRLFKSLGYALRSFVARKTSIYYNHINSYAVMSEFQRNKLVEAGYPSEKITIIHNPVDAGDYDAEVSVGDYFAYAGRISAEKGIHILLAACRKCPSIPFKFAGPIDSESRLVWETLPNVEYLGFLDQDALQFFLAGARAVVAPSVCYEGMSISVLQAMVHGKPTICSRIGALADVVEDGTTGLLVQPGNEHDLAQTLRSLWHQPNLCRKMGEAAREKVAREHSVKGYYRETMAMYEKALMDNSPEIVEGCQKVAAPMRPIW